MITTGNGGTITNANATGSICPKGWKLPSSGSAPGMSKGTFAYLLQQYGLASAHDIGSLTGTSPVNGNSYNIALSPLFFVRGGYIYTNNKLLYDAGQRSDYWSSRAVSNTSFAYYLNFSSGNVYPSDGHNRYLGQFLRCLISTP